MQALACFGIYEGKKVTLSGGRVSIHCQRFANSLQAQGSEAASGLLKLEARVVEMRPEVFLKCLVLGRQLMFQSVFT